MSPGVAREGGGGEQLRGRDRGSREASTIEEAIQEGEEGDEAEAAVVGAGMGESNWIDGEEDRGERGIGVSEEEVRPAGDKEERLKGGKKKIEGPRDR